MLTTGVLTDHDLKKVKSRLMKMLPPHPWQVALQEALWKFSLGGCFESSYPAMTQGRGLSPEGVLYFCVWVAGVGGSKQQKLTWI